MAGSMAREDIITDLKASVHDAAGIFDGVADADWLRMLDLAVSAMQSKRPRTLLGSVELVADEPRYDLSGVPDFFQFKTHLWGSRQMKPWDPGYPGALPRVSAVQDGSGSALAFDPAPTCAHLAAHGSTFRFWYFGVHRVGDTAELTTIDASDRRLLVLRAQAEVMRELAMHNVNKPLQLRDGFSGAPRNSTPAALYEALLREWEAER